MKKYGPAAQKNVARVMHEMKRGTLHSGKSDTLVTNRTQTIAIGLSEARRSGAKVPLPKIKRSVKRTLKNRDDILDL